MPNPRYFESRGTGSLHVDREKIIEALGGIGAVEKMDAETRAEALEEHLLGELDMETFARMGAPREPLTVHELDEQIVHRPIRRGIGTLSLRVEPIRLGTDWSRSRRTFRV